MDDRGCGGVLITTCKGLFSILFHGSYSCDKENKVKKKFKKKKRREKRERKVKKKRIEDTYFDDLFLCDQGF